MGLGLMHLSLDGLDFLTWLDLGLSILMYFLNSVIIRKKKTNKQEKTRKMLLCALVNDDLIQENIISYCFFTMLYLRFFVTYPVAHAP